MHCINIVTAKQQQNAEDSPRDPRPIQCPAKVLIRTYADGYCELYADQHVQVYVQKILSAPGMEGERLALEYADSTLPASHRGLDDARKLIQTFDCRPCTVADFVTRQAALGALRIMDAYQKRASA
jgi:hypothetical protein